MTNLHLFAPSIGSSEFEQPSNSATSYAVGGRSELHRVTQSQQRGNLRRAGARGRGVFPHNRLRIVQSNGARTRDCKMNITCAAGLGFQPEGAECYERYDARAGDVRLVLASP